MSSHIIEPLRHLIGRVLYEEPGHARNWNDLDELRKSPWLYDADRVIVAIVERAAREQAPEAVVKDSLITDALKEILAYFHGSAGDIVADEVIARRGLANGQHVRNRCKLPA